MYWANAIGLPVQINTTVSRRNLGELQNILSVVRNSRIVMWSLFFVVPTGRAETVDLPSPKEFESAFAEIYRLAQDVPFKVKTTEAQHYRRYLLQQRPGKDREEMLANGVPGILPINEGKGFMFISHTGEVQPSGFLPLSAGNVRRSSVRDIYRDSELFRNLRDTDNLQGKCGDCEFREICGGSRARACALSGNAFAEDPSCIYFPRQRGQNGASDRNSEVRVYSSAPTSLIPVTSVDLRGAPATCGSTQDPNPASSCLFVAA